MKETYDKVHKWITENKEFVEKVKVDRTWSFHDYQTIIYWYERVSEYKEFSLGEKILSLEDIQKIFLEDLPEEEGFEFSDHPMYDEDGYCSRAMFQEIKHVWENLDESTFMDIAIGDYDDVIDFQGGRSYLLSGKMPLYFFNYIYYTLKLSKEGFQDKIYNSTSFNDDIQDFYPPDISILSDKSRETRANKTIKINDLKKERKVTEFLVKYPKEMEEDLKELKHLHFVGYSKIDNNPIYQIEMALPENFEIINSIEKHEN